LQGWEEHNEAKLKLILPYYEVKYVAGRYRIEGRELQGKSLQKERNVNREKHLKIILN